MTTFGEKGNVLKSTRGPVQIDGGAAPEDQQLAPPTDYLPDDSDTPPDIAELTAGDEDIEKPEPLTDTEREADYQAAQSRVDAGLPSHAGDVEKLANRPAPEYPARTFREGEPRSEGAVGVVAPDQATPEPGSVVAIDQRFDVTEAGESWPYDMLEFKGDLLGIRLPQRQALAAFSLASSKYVSLGVKNDLTGLFIARHLSPESYGRVFSRLMDPDEDNYDVDTVGELFNAIVTASIDADKASGNDAG